MKVDYYYIGDCTDPLTQAQIADNFIHTLNNDPLFSNLACKDTGCNAGNVQVGECTCKITYSKIKTKLLE